MIKHLSDSGKSSLIQLYNKILLESFFSSVWSKAILLPFLKPNKDPASLSSYRPIVLTSCLCKLLEKIINNRLMHILETKAAITPIQCGFRRYRSSEDVLVRMQAAILDSFAQHKHLFAVYFYIEKAYDTTWRYRILKEIHNIGIRGALACFIKNFLNNRQFQVKLGRILSQEYTQEQGTSQGSALSCTLFMIAINNIASALPPSVSATMYVDDLAIYMQASNVVRAQRVLQNSINRIANWAQNKGYKISQDKTVAIHYHNKRVAQADPVLLLDNKATRFKDHTRFLGLYFDKKNSVLKNISKKSERQD